MKKSHFGDFVSFPAEVSPPLLLVFINFVFVFLLGLLIEVPVGCLLGPSCPIAHFPGFGPDPKGLQVLVPPLCSLSRIH